MLIFYERKFNGSTDLSHELRFFFKLKDSVKERKYYSMVEDKFKSIYLETIAKVIDDII